MLINSRFVRSVAVRKTNSAKIRRQAVACRRVVSIALIVTLFPSAVRAAIVVSLAQQASLSFVANAPALISPRRLSGRAVPQDYTQSRGMPPLPASMPGIRSERTPNKQERQAKVQKLEINPSRDLTLQTGQQMIFAAVPLDQDGNAIHGLKTEWESSDLQVISISGDGDIEAKKLGSAVVTATVVNKKEKVKVTVVLPSRRASASSTDRGDNVVVDNKITTEGSKLNRPHRVNNLQRTARKERGLMRAHVPGTLMTPMPTSGDDIPSLFYASNAVGAPPGKTTPGAGTPGAAAASIETPGSANFSFGVPLVSLPGRNFDLNLGMVYNSRVWNKSTTTSNHLAMSYGVDGGWPAAGFRLGFGQWMSNFTDPEGNPTSGTLIDADGTRHQMKDTSTDPQNPSCVYDSTDGTSIHAVAPNCSGTITVTYPDGGQARYDDQGWQGYTFPSKITDRNGNYILISYYQGIGGLISTIQDTLGRYVRFYYDSNYNLVSITAPGFNGQADRQVARFYYDNVNPSQAGLFPSGTVITAGSGRVIKYIYFPNSVESGDAHIGYRYDYSAYGMIYQITQFRGMTVSTSDLNNSGTVQSEGTQAAVSSYNYPIYPSSLTDAPTYTTRTDDWAGRVSDQPVWHFSVNQSSGVSIVTAPDGTVSETHSIVHQGFWDDGLITDGIFKTGSTELSHTVLHWDPSSSANLPQLTSTKTTNETGQTKAIVYVHDGYNNVTSASERDLTSDGSISSIELRRTETSYVTSSSYTSRGLVHLSSTVKVFGSTDNLVLQTDYGYDEGSLTSYSDLNSAMMYSDPGTTARGNLTRTRTYPDVANLSSYIDHSTTFDVAGNALTAQVDCCQQKTLSYSGTYFHAYQTSVTSGNGPTLATSASYDFNTGLVSTTTDENGQVTSFSYNADSLRPAHIDYPNGGAVAYGYNDDLLTDAASRQHSYAVVSTKLDAPGGTARYVSSYRFFDGRGAVTQTFSNYTSANGWSTQDIEYDVMGRGYRSSQPYYSAGYGAAGINPAGLWTAQTFDNLGRVTRIDMPSGDAANPTSTYATTAYAGIFTTVTDQSGKQRRQKIDGLGRVIRLDEPDANGNLGGVDAPNQSTSYEYNTLDNLIHIAQGSQNRYFKYDSLSRLTYERQVEQDAPWTTSDSVAGNNQWSRKFIYNSQGRVQDAYDARQINTHFDYDGLNRVYQITYSDSTPAAHFFYDSQGLPNGAPSYDHGYATGHLIAMTYGASTSTTGNYFGYDNIGNVVTHRQVTGSNTYAMSYAYNLGGLLTGEIYPTGRALTYAFDEAGRLASLTEGATTYASGFSYEPHGGLSAETFGNGMVHSLSYNRSLQASEIKLKQSANGAELQRFNYSYGLVNQSDGSVDTTKNNGQIGRTDGYIGGAKQWDQRFSYDSLSRISTAAEYRGDNGGQSWQTHYDYDLFGNRMQYQANSNVAYTTVQASDISPARNRFIESGTLAMTYDPAGNITVDRKFRDMNYSYDSNGRMLTAEHTDHTNHQDSVYDCGGQRVQTSAGGTTRQMVYDIFGQSIADYANNSLEGENLYRGGQLLLVAETSATTAAPSPTGLAASPSSSNVGLTWSAASGATNYRVERKGAGGSFAFLGHTSSSSITDTGATNGNAYLYQVCAADGNDNCTSSYSNIVLGARFNFPTDSTITTIADDPSGVTATTMKAAHITELRAAVNAVRSLAGLAAAGWTHPNLQTGDTIYKDDVQDLRDRLNDALTALGIQTSAYDDSTLAGAPNGTLIKGVHIRQLRTRATSGSGTGGSDPKLQPAGATASRIHSAPYDASHAIDGNPNTLWSAGDFAPQWIQVDLGQLSNISKVRLLVDQSPNGHTTHQVYAGATPDSMSLLGTFDGNTSFGQWLELNATAGSVRYVKVSTSLSPSWVGWAEIEVYGTTSSAPTLHYVLSDLQGSARALMNNSGAGSSTVIARHDYLPFGEEIGYGTGLRTQAQGYGAADTNRQKYSLLERDSTTGLDHTSWRKYESTAGRWTSPDPIRGGNPYSYAGNDPINLIDPSGLMWDFPEASQGWDHFSAGFWGWGDLNNRPHGHFGPLDTEPCPPGHICFQQSIGGREGPRYDLVDFGMFDPFDPQDPILGGPRVQKCDSPVVKAELTALQKRAKAAGDIAGQKAAGNYPSSMSPGQAVLEGTLSTVLYHGLTKAPLTVAGVAGSGGVGLAVHGVLAFIIDDYKSNAADAKARGEAYSKVMNDGVKKIEEKWHVELPHGNMWPMMSPCK